MQNPFHNPAFSMAALTAAINILPNRYGRLEELNLFPSKPVRTRQILVEEMNGVLNLLPTLPPGSPGTVGRRGKRKLRSFVIPHIPHDDVVLPEEVQGIRAFGSETETEAVAGVFTLDLLIAATEAGMEARWLSGRLADLKKEIERGRPAIVFLNLLPNPLPARHFAVAVGHLHHQGRHYLVLHSGPDPYLMVPEKKFKRQWKRTGNMMMTIKPKPADADGAGP